MFREMVLEKQETGLEKLVRALDEKVMDVKERRSLQMLKELQAFESAINQGLRVVRHYTRSSKPRIWYSFNEQQGSEVLENRLRTWMYWLDSWEWAV